MMPGSQDMTRRAVLGGLVAVGLPACSAPRPKEAANSSDPSPEASPSPEGTLTPAQAYAPLPGEVRPACKKTAADAVQRALTWSDSDGRDVFQRLADLPDGDRIAESLRPLATDDAACVTSVAYPQYGGLNSRLSSASVMLVGRQTFLRQGGGQPRAREFILDMRLSLRGSDWRITSIEIGQTPPAGNPDPETGRLLANPHVRLPEPARADLEAAVIIPEVATLLNALSHSWRLDVQVLRTGHPRNVFATDRISNHTRGRAIDIWAINGTPVVKATRSLWEPVLKEAARLGSTEVGGPGLPERATNLPPVFFTNPTHEDHLHLGFEPVRR